MSDIVDNFPKLMYLDYKLCRDSTVNTGNIVEVVLIFPAGR